MSTNLSDSKFYMWRAIVALVYADGKKYSEEEEFLEKYFKALPLSADQKATLESDMVTPADLDECFAKITEPADRSQFIYFARLLFHSDGDFDITEEELLGKLKGSVTQQVDMDKVMKEVNQTALDFIEKENTRKEKRPFYEKLVDALVFWEDL